jgi:SAM-dependent methyltransferase
MSDKHDQYMSSVEDYFNKLPNYEFENVKCFYCRTPNDRVLLFKKGSMEVFRCRCGFVYNGRQPTKKALDKFYEESNAMTKWGDLKETWEEKVRQKSKFQDAVKYLENKSIQSILDIGCGNGYFLDQFDKRIKRVGIELNPYAADIARRKGLQIHEWSIEKMFKEYSDRKFKFSAVSLLVQFLYGES